MGANTFREKYNYLPGDIKDPDASNFGFQARGSCPGQGNGDGLIEGWGAGSTCINNGSIQAGGEAVVFWVDLSTAHLIDGGFNTALTTIAQTGITASSTPNIASFFPAAKIGRGNYIYVYEGGAETGTPPTGFNGYNYYGISAITGVNQWITSTPGLTVAEAYAIDSKIDDGLPQTGRVTAQYAGHGGPTGWNTSGLPNSAGAGYNSSTDTASTGGSSTTCYDNGNANGVTQHYSSEINNGADVNCALSFQMQAGD
jgi:hypothetical protein